MRHKYYHSRCRDRLAPVRLKIYEIAGRLVRTLIDQHLKPGNYHLSWDGRDKPKLCVKFAI